MPLKVWYLLKCRETKAQFSRVHKICDIVLFIFLVDEGKEDPNTTISGLSSVRQ